MYSMSDCVLLIFFSTVPTFVWLCYVSWEATEIGVPSVQSFSCYNKLTMR